MVCLWYRTVIRRCLVWARGNDQDDGADNRRQTLIRLRGQDAIGDAALREADDAVTLHAHAEKTTEPT
jgi:hypothetical protein